MPSGKYFVAMRQCFNSWHLGEQLYFTILRSSDHLMAGICDVFCFLRRFAVSESRQEELGAVLGAAGLARCSQKVSVQPGAALPLRNEFCLRAFVDFFFFLNKVLFAKYVGEGGRG